MIFVLLLLSPGRFRAWRVATTATSRWRRRTASPFRFAFALLYFPAYNHSYFFFLPPLDEEEELPDEELEGLLLLLFFLSLSLRRSGQSFFLIIYTNIPVTLSAAQSALVIGLGSFGFFRLTSNLHLDSWFIDVFSIHFFNSLLDSFFAVKYLNDSLVTMKA